MAVKRKVTGKESAKTTGTIAAAARKSGHKHVPCKKWARDNLIYDREVGKYRYLKKCVERGTPRVPKGAQDWLFCADMTPSQILGRRNCGEIGKKAHEEHRLAYLKAYYKKNKKEIIEKAKKRREAKPSK